jgi:hypothetical protein
VASGVGGEPLEHCPPQRLLAVVAVARAWGGSRSGAAAAHGAGWSSEQPPMEIERERGEDQVQYRSSERGEDQSR